MKGMLDFLEKAGLVKKDPATEPAPAVPRDTDSAPGSDHVAPNTSTAAVATAGAGLPLNLDDIYANGRIAPSLYPAERLLRLVDGLSAMDEATRLMAIKAMDAADESWSIEDPLADAAAKVKALAAYAEQRQLNLLALEAESQTRLEAVAARQAQVVGDIRKQITELEALVSRELTRAAQETATQEATLKAAQDQTARELDEISRISQQLQGLAVQFGTPTTPQE
ncbi:methyl-accepting chemotaxis protein [Rhodoferax ferrireducens]|uniref:methyl-accepting chemotaxis protein n=1 Tax=Rhodoferax ferrireducens TaxID=192843 RepID=UPI000E0D6AE6|nr:methyl-accepting chemotaxis protein [Rhodoferax ferrireducens]